MRSNRNSASDRLTGGSTAHIEREGRGSDDYRKCDDRRRSPDKPTPESRCLRRFRGARADEPPRLTYAGQNELRAEDERLD